MALRVHASHIAVSLQPKRTCRPCSSTCAVPHVIRHASLALVLALRYRAQLCSRCFWVRCQLLCHQLPLLVLLCRPLSPLGLLSDPESTGCFVCTPAGAIRLPNAAAHHHATVPLPQPARCCYRLCHPSTDNEPEVGHCSCVQRLSGPPLDELGAAGWRYVLAVAAAHSRMVHAFVTDRVADHVL